MCMENGGKSCGKLLNNYIVYPPGPFLMKEPVEK